MHLAPHLTAIAQEQTLAIRSYRITFTGDGFEYFKVAMIDRFLHWISEGLSAPFERYRAQRYFYGHTRIAGHCLEFTAPLSQLYKAFFVALLIGAGLCLVLAIMANLSAHLLAALLVGGILVLWPLLSIRAMRFHAMSVGWRGVQLDFPATTAQFYGASWPFLLVALLWAGVVMVSPWLLDHMLPFGAGKTAGRALPWIGGILLPVLTLSITGSVMARLNRMRLMVQSTSVGHQPCHWKPRPGETTSVWWSVAAASLLTTVLAAVLLTLALSQIQLDNPRQPVGHVLIAIAVIAGAQKVSASFCDARLFTLFWNSVQIGETGRFRCSLQCSPYMAMTIRDDLLTLCCAGFYLPFAGINRWRMKAESVTLYLKGGVDQLTNPPSAQPTRLRDAIADASGLGLMG